MLKLTHSRQEDTEVVYVTILKRFEMYLNLLWNVS